MSLVGTRPILQDELLKYELHHRARIAIKPGITGMWQVSGRSDITDFEEVVRLDTEYISKGVTIGQENRGKRKGTPCIGNNVWIGVNATIVGNVVIGNDVLIAPNTYINCDIPDHSIVFGNPCIVKHADDATKDYINHAWWVHLAVI